MMPRPCAVWLLVLVAVGACANKADEPGPTLPPQTTIAAREPGQTALQPPPNVEVVVGTPTEGFSEVEAALAAAMERWKTAGPEAYAYRVTVDCDCPDRGESWVRVFDRQLPDLPSQDVDALFGEIADMLDQPPPLIEVAFDADLGIPVWFTTQDEGSKTTLVDEFHQITRTATPFDGEWRFLGGELLGREFGNPASGLIVFTLQDGSFGYPHDCNQAGGPVDIHGSHFGTEPALTFTTLVGCPEYSQEAELFAEALFASTAIEQRNSRLVLTGENSVLEFDVLQEPELMGALAVTAPGETMTIDAVGENLASVFTISDAAEDPARSIAYVLTTAPTGSGQTPTWAPWAGEVEVPPARPGAVEVMIPDRITVGDYRLCSPYWSNDYYCYDLPVRPPSAPWYVTAGADGVVLHDADGTSETVWEEAARIAFWFEDLMVVEPESGPVLTVAASGATSELAPAGSRLLDAVLVGDSVTALLVRNGRTVLVGTDPAGETLLGDEALEGRIAGEAVILRTSATRIEARSVGDGAALWELTVDEAEMISSAGPTQLRLDSGRLNTDGSAISFWQYLDTRIVETSTGEVTDEHTRELAIPMEGDEGIRPCLRAELRDGLMLCPQPDGRLMTIGVEGGDQLTVAGLSDVIATYVRVTP